MWLSAHSLSLEMKSAMNSKLIFFVLFLQADPWEERMSRNSETQKFNETEIAKKKKSLMALSKSNVKKGV